MTNVSFSAKIVALYCIFLFLQFALYNYVVIYPSLVFSLFSSAPAYKDSITIPVSDLYGVTTKGTYILLPENEFFSDFYYEHNNNLFLATLADNEQHYKQNARLTKNRTLFINYAARQLYKLHPGDLFNALVIVKGNQIYNMANESLSSDTLDITRTMIPLN